MTRHGLITAGFMLAFAVLGVVYAVMTPLYETSDEVVHYPVIEYIKARGVLPVQELGVRTRFEQEGSQPPLYYLLGALLTAPIDTSDFDAIHWRNPHGKVGVTFLEDNKNFVIHTEAERWPWRGTVLATQIVRLFSVGLGVGTVGMTGLLVQAWWPDEEAVLVGALALVAFNPMFLHITASVNNDNLIIFLAAWMMVVCSRMVQEGLTTRRVWVLAVLFMLGSLTKVSGLTFAALIGAVFVVIAVRDGAWRAVFRAGFVLLAVWTVGAGWWYVRNVMLYGEITGTASQVAIVGGRDITLWEAISGGYYNFWLAYWGWFGSLNILPEGWMVRVFAALTILSMAGLAVWIAARAVRGDWEKLLPVALFGGQVLVMVGGVLSWTMRTYASQGRLVFPAIGAISMLCALGLTGPLPRRWRLPSVAIWALPLGVVAVTVPFRLIAPAYAPPPLVERLPEDATPVGAEWGPLELVGVRAGEPVVRAGGFVPVTAYWRLNAPLEDNLSMVYRVAGREVLGQTLSYPGGGTWATSTMPVGVIVEDRYRVQVTEEVDAPTLARATISVGRQEAGQFVVLRSDSAQLAVEVDAGVVLPQTCAAWSAEGAQQLGDIAEVRVLSNPSPTVTFGERVNVAMIWLPLARTVDPQPLTLRVHDEAGRIWQETEHQPLGGNYSTAAWVPGCAYVEAFTFPLTAITRVGSYNLTLSAGGSAEVLLKRLEVTTP